MARTARCRYCLEPIEKTDLAKKVNGKQYHMSCYKEMIAKQYNEQKANHVLDEKGELYDYILKLYKVKEVDPKIMAQIDKYHKEYNLSYKRITLSLVYYYEIKKEDVNPNYGIGILPYIYKDAEKFWTGVNSANEKNSNKQVDKSIGSVKYKVPKTPAKRTDLIDIDKL